MGHLASDTAGFSPAIETKDPQGVGLGQDGEVNRHPKLVVVSESGRKKLDEAVVVTDGRVDYMAGGEEFACPLPYRRDSLEADEFAWVPVGGSQVDKPAHTFTTLSPVILQPVTVSPSIEKLRVIASRALQIVF